MQKRIISLIAITTALCTAVAIACAQDTYQPYEPPAFETSGNSEFDAWRTDFARRAVNTYGKDKNTIESMLTGLTPNDTVTRLNGSQPEVIKPIWEYIDNAVSNARIGQGQTLYSQHQSILADASQQTGVPIEIAIAIWGMESGFGANKGQMDVVRSLATFAYKGRRTQLGETELLAVSDILSNNYASRSTLIGSWAGAMGHTQFMPSSYLARAIDGNNDGIRDIWNNSDDALASTMNFLKISGWRANEPWGVKVEVPSSFDYSIADGSFHNLEYWTNNGVILSRNIANDWNARLFIPAGKNGPKYLVGVNYQAIRSYNASDSYALSVAFLADAIKQTARLPSDWPRNDPPLRRTQAIELQALLSRLGYDVGAIDGAPGTITKNQLQKFQKANDLIADGYPSISALNDLRRIAGVVEPQPEIITPAQNGPQPIRMFGPPVQSNQTNQAEPNN